ncbi:MAG: hypothetical protein V4622_01895 [Bacteroidota bacterium]
MLVKSIFSYHKETHTETLRLRLLDNGIVHYTYLLNSEIGEREHKLNHRTYVDFVENDKKMILVDSEGYNSVSPEARKLIRSLEKIVPISKRAIVISTLHERLLANFYITFHKPIIPTKIFKCYEEAFSWLKSN